MYKTLGITIVVQKQGHLSNVRALSLKISIQSTNLIFKKFFGKLNLISYCIIYYFFSVFPSVRTTRSRWIDKISRIRLTSVTPQGIRFLIFLSVLKFNFLVVKEARIFNVNHFSSKWSWCWTLHCNKVSLYCMCSSLGVGSLSTKFACTVNNFHTAYSQ
jgi:hypothetical protein